MGGYGSGRHGARPTIESTGSYILDISSLAPAFRKGKFQAGTIRFDDGRFVVAVVVDLRNEWNSFVQLIHPARDVWDGEERTITGIVHLTRTQPTFGGHRWWFLCPRTGYRTTKLFLPNGGRHFLSRHAYRLGYASQREDRFSRLQRRAAMLNRRLGGDGWATWADPPAKPKGMRWATYERKIAQWERAVERAHDVWISGARRLLSRLDRQQERRGQSMASLDAGRRPPAQRSANRRPAPLTGTDR